MQLRSKFVYFLTLYADICNLIRRVAPPAVSLASKLILICFMTLLP